MAPSPAEIWTALGGAGELPRFGRFCRGPLLILGGAACVWEDFARVRPWGGEIMAVNDIGAHLHDIVRHWCTLHPEYLAGWRAYRAGHCYGEGVPPSTHAPRWRDGVDRVWSMSNYGDTSGLFACFVGLMLGYESIVLAGVPATDEPHYFDPPWQRCSGYDPGIAWSTWSWASSTVFAGRVKSLSGNTRDWLGAPA